MTNALPAPPPGFFDDDPPRTTPDDLPMPLTGLDHLPHVALVGRERILASARAPISWTWDGIAVEGTIVMLAAAPSEGKTTALFLVLAARANLGAPVTFLGRIIQPARLGKYLILIEGEHAEGSACRKLLKSCKLLGVHDAALDRIILIARKAVRLGSPEWGDVVRLITAGLVSDVAIDTVARVAPADGASEKEQVVIFDELARAIDTAPTVADRPMTWVCAHTRKNNTSGGLDDVSGSAQRVGQADSVLMLKAERVDGRVIASRVLFAKLREEPDEYPAPISFSTMTGKLEERKAESDQSPADGRTLEERIVELLAAGPKTKTKLRETLHRNMPDLEIAITNLFEAKTIKTASVDVNGRSIKGFALRENRPVLDTYSTKKEGTGTDTRTDPDE